MNFFSRSTSTASHLRQIHSMRNKTAGLTDGQLAESVADMRQKFGVVSNSITPTGLAGQRKNRNQFDSNATSQIVALADEAVYRTFGFRLHDVQLQSILASANGVALEMQTGEGKTIVSGVIAFVQTFLFADVHLATTNAYLAERDHAELKPVFDRLGISTGLVSHAQPASKKREAYSADVTFGPGYQFGFDYLADQVALRNQRAGRLGHSTLCSLEGFDVESVLLQPGDFGAMIVDEADSIMIDEAMTPLILSGQPSNQQIDPESPLPYQRACALAESLCQDVDYFVSKEPQQIRLTQTAADQMHRDFQSLNLQLTRPWQKYVENAIHANHFLIRNEHYVVADDKVKIVDQFTGRIFDDRQWQDGLHQAVEAKEKVEIQPANLIQAQISRQRYFMLYESLIGLSGTLMGTQKELRSVYRLPVTTVATNRKSQRSELPARFFASAEARLAAIAESVKTKHEQGQPVLIGTRTIKQSLLVEAALRCVNLDPVVLNGIQDEAEAEIVAQAGQSGALTIATNMAGRGTDIKLSETAISMGGLHVIGCEHNGSRRIDRQLIGRCARQGQPGSSQFYASSDDEMIELFGARLGNDIKNSAGRTSSGEVPDKFRATFSIEIRRIQTSQELRSLKTRQQMMRTVNWLDQVRDALTNKNPDKKATG